jgi:omega-hydroxy-beta-dihydromenaquinone-9 sulfotransferase
MLDLLLGHGVDLRRVPRAVGFTMARAMMGPLAAIDRARHRREIDALRLRPPVFILGHWRTGTTYLHNLLSLDPQFGWVSTLETIAPEAALSFGPLLRRMFQPLLPATRPFDAMPLRFDAPQEEELALVSMGVPNFYFGYFYFPRADERYFRECLLFDEGPASLRAGFTKGLLTVLKRAALRQPDRTLLLKNPPHTGRVRLLLELFPDARFIHIARDPHAVFASTNHMRATMIRVQGLQQVDDAYIRNRTVAFYKGMMQRYLDERASIAPGRLVELRLEDLEEKPLEVLNRLYDTLGLAGFEAARPRFREAAEAARSYRKNVFTPAPETAALLRREWGFAFDAFGYA